LGKIRRKRRKKWKNPLLKIN